MERSQLRRLALSYAEKKVDVADYLATRSKLIDDIVAGHVAIDRDSATYPEPTDEHDLSPNSDEPADKSSRTWLSGKSWWLAAPAAALIVIALWLAISKPSPPTPKRTSGPTYGTADPEHVPSEFGPREVLRTPNRGSETAFIDTEGTHDRGPRPAALAEQYSAVEQLLGSASWEPADISAFQIAWSQWSDPDRSALKTTPSFRKMTAKLRTEANDALALADSGQDPVETERAIRIITLGEQLGMENLAQASPSRAETSIEPPPGSRFNTSDPRRAETPKTPGPLGAKKIALSPPGHHSGSPASSGKRSELGARLVPSAGLAHPLGASTGPESTSSPSLESEPTPRLQSASDSHQPTERPRAETNTLDREGRARPPPFEREWLQAQSPSHYTVQLFASQSLDSAEALVEGYPDLALRIQRADEGLAQFRVVMGSFITRHGADRAAGQLPPALKRQIGKPFVRSFRSLREP